MALGESSFPEPLLKLVPQEPVRHATRRVQVTQKTRIAPNGVDVVTLEPGLHEVPGHVARSLIAMGRGFDPDAETKEEPADTLALPVETQDMPGPGQRRGKRA